MVLEYSPHARQKMIERGITDAEVELVMQAPDQNYPHPRVPGSKVAVKSVNGRQLKVIYINPSILRTIIVTVFPTGKP